ncbi:MAG: tRNA lysidine(34) synthetase TilS, partial [Nannocystaceae bacterium]|nr:tRNA lysidine(34) synthetase TilS [Nannocystaceae bacterium]
MPPRHPDIAHALGPARAVLKEARAADAVDRGVPLGLLVGCSGGRDSVALLGLLALLAASDGLSLTVGHVHHGLRSASEREAALVEDLGGQLGFPVLVRRLHLDAEAPGLPARAREARHAALHEMRRELGAHRIALAHTATDQAETVLMHLSRGAGLRGLAGMQSVEPNSAVVRPVLDLPRARTGPLCTRLGLAYVDDPTNDDVDHPRVRIRRDVLPWLAQGRGGVEGALAASALAAREAADALDVWVERERRARCCGEHRYDLTEWRGLPRAVRIGWLQTIALHAGVPIDGLGRRSLSAIDRGLL